MDSTIGSPGAGATSGSHLETLGARVEYKTGTPAFLARVSSETMAGTITSLQIGCFSQIGPTTSKINNAVVAGLRMTRTGSGRAGICRVSCDISLRHSFPCAIGRYSRLSSRRFNKNFTYTFFSQASHIADAREVSTAISESLASRWRLALENSNYRSGGDVRTEEADP